MSRSGGPRRPRRSCGSHRFARAPATAAAVLLAAGLVVLAACGGSSDDLTLLGAGSPSPGLSASGGSASSGPGGVSPSPSATGPTPSASAPSPSVSVTGPSPSPSLTGPSPSPSPTSAADELAVYLAAVKPIRNRFHRLAVSVNKVIWTDTPDYADASWPPAGRKVSRMIAPIDQIRVDWDLVTAPATLVKAHAAYLRCMRQYQLAYDKVAFCFKNKADWSADTANGRRFTALWNSAERSFDVFKHEVMVQTRTLHVKLPWKWSR
jgi:hypothetical protein